MACKNCAYATERKDSIGRLLMPKQIFNYDIVEFEENKSKLVKLQAITHLLESVKINLLK